MLSMLIKTVIFAEASSPKHNPTRKQFYDRTKKIKMLNSVSANEKLQIAQGK